MANVVDGMDVSAIAKVVKSFNDDFKASLLLEQDKVKRAMSDRDTEAYRFAAGLLDLALVLKPETPAPALVEFLNARGQRTVKEGDNPYSPFVKAVIAVEQSDGKWKFNPKEASFAKYANIVRQLVEDHSNGEITGSTEAYIASYKWNGRSKLGALEAKDRYQRPNASQVARVEALRDKGRKARVVETLETKVTADEGDVVVLWGVMKNGKLEVMKREVSNDRGPSLFHQLGRELNAA